MENGHRRRRILLPLAVLVISLALVMVSRAMSAATRLQRDAQALQAMSASGMLSASSPNLSVELDAKLSQTIQDFRDLRGTVGWLAWLGPMFGWVPRYGGDLANAPALMDWADHLANSAQDLLSISQTINTEIDAGRASSTPIGVSVLRATESQSSQIQRAQQDLAETIRARKGIDMARLSPSLQSLVSRFDEWQPLWQTGLDGLAAAPTLLGADQPRVYLLVAQNSDELRATGGFITGVSLLKIDHGNISVSNFKDSYSVDNLNKAHPAAPGPLQRYMYAYYWVFRDGNWSPDFPTTARQLEALYQIDQGITADGVIAVNQKLLPQLLEAMGPVTLDTYNETINASNAMAKIQEYWASPLGLGQSTDWWEHRKDFTGKLFEAMMGHLMSGDLDRVKLASALVQGIMSKDLLIYVNDSGATIPSSLSNMDSLFSGPGDALMLVDSNVGFNKVDSNVRRQLDYAVNVDESGSMQATVTITYTNLSAANGTFCVHVPYFPTQYSELQQGCYWDYVRLIVPPRAEMIEATRELNATAEVLSQGRTSLGGYFFVERGKKKTIHFSYRVPSLIQSGSDYILRLEKQPGSPNIPATIRVTLPEGWHVRSADPSPVQTLGNTFEFSVTLDRDQEIAILVDRTLSPWMLAAGILGLGLCLALVAWQLRRNRVRSRAMPA